VKKLYSTYGLSLQPGSSSLGTALGATRGVLPREFRDMNLEAEGPVIFSGPTVALTVFYEYLFYHPTGDRL
jgi:hypothetical protein